MFRFRLTFLAICFAILTWAPPDPSGAQSVATLEPETATRFEFPLTIRSIMRGPEILGQPPTGVQWSDDSRWVYFRWLPGGRAWSDSPELYRVPSGGGEPERVEDDAAEDLAITFARGVLSPDRRLRLSSMGGDLYLVERGNLRTTRLTETEDSESAVGFRTDGDAIFFLRAGNLYEMTLDRGLIRQLTDIQEGSPPREAEEATGQKGFLEDQQEKLFEYIRLQKAEQAEREAERERAQEGEPEPLYIPRGERVQGLEPNGDATFVAADIPGIIEKLDYLADLGVNVVHLMPVQEYLHYPDAEWQAAFANDPFAQAMGIDRENYQWGYRTTCPKTSLRPFASVL